MSSRANGTPAVPVDLDPAGAPPIGHGQSTGFPAPRQVILTAALAAGYVVVAKLSLTLASVHPSATSVWPPTGIAIAALLILGPSVWPGIFVGAFLTNITTEGTVWTSLGIATGNTLEAVIAAFLVTRYAGGRQAFDRPQDIFKFAALAAILSTAVSATFGVTSLSLGGFAPWYRSGQIWLTWWLGDAVGALTAAPLILLWQSHPPARWDGRRLVERGVFLLALLAVSWIIFSGQFPFEYLTVPFLMWAAFRFHRRETATVIALLSLIAVWATVNGRGPFGSLPRNDALVLLQVFVGIMALVALPVGSVVAAERSAHQSAERAARRTALLQAVTAALSEALTPEQIGQVILQYVIDEIGAAAAAVSLLADEPDSLTLLSAVGYSDAIAERWRRNTGDIQPIYDAMRARQVVWYSSWADFRARYPQAVLPAEPARRGARAAVPLVLHGRPIGAVYMNFREPRQFDGPALEFMQTLGRLCAQALDRARLYEAEKRAREAAEEAARRTQRLQAVTAALSSAVTPLEVAEVILSEGLRVLNGEAGVIYRLRDDEAALEMLHSKGYPEEVRLAWARIPLAAATGSAEAARTLAPLYFESRDDLLKRYPGLAGRINPHAGRRAFVPLRSGRRPIGVLLFVFAEARAFRGEELGFIEALADHCRHALERAQLYEAQRATADTLQRAFLPLALPEIPGVTISAAYAPSGREAQVGGDWYDAFALPDGRIALSVGDVVGHGLRAAVVMGQLRQTVRAAALESGDPAAVLVKANRVLVHSHGPDAMATTCFGILDPATMVFTYASAGHPAPMLCRPTTGVVDLTAGTLPLGVTASIAPDVQEIALPPGAVLILYTDGLVEQTHNLEEGEARVRAAAEGIAPEPPADAAQRILTDVLGRQSPADDIALMVVAVAAAPFDRFALRLPADPAGVRAVRHALRRLGATLALPAAQFTGLLVAVGEAVNNAVEHAYGPGDGTVEIRAGRTGDRVVVEIEDHGHWRAERQEGRGHGLRLMRGLVDDMEVDRRPSGTIVRLSLHLPHAAPAPAAGERARAAHAVTIPAPPGPSGTGSPPPGTDGGDPITLHGFELRLVNALPLVTVAGDIDLENEALFAQALERTALYDRPVIAVSLARTSYIDSRGIHALLRFGARLATNRRRLLVIAPRGSMARRILDTMNVSAAYRVCETVEEAVAETVV